MKRIHGLVLAGGILMATASAADAQVGIAIGPGGVAIGNPVAMGYGYGMPGLGYGGYGYSSYSYSSFGVPGPFGGFSYSSGYSGFAPAPFVYGGAPIGVYGGAPVGIYGSPYGYPYGAAPFVVRRYSRPLAVPVLPRVIFR